MIFPKFRQYFILNCYLIYISIFALFFSTSQAKAKTIFNSSFKPTSIEPVTDTTEISTTSTTSAPQLVNRDITIGPCTWVIGRKCPDSDITFYLYTRKNPSDRQYLKIDNSLETSNVTNSFYDSKHPSKIIIHGYNSDMFLHPLQMMKMEYLAKGDYNIFYVDWSKLSPGPCYISAVHNTRHAGSCVAQLVERILDLGSTDIHVIGFSLGAHLTNYIAKNLGTFQLPRITDPFPCSHQRATTYFLESIRSTKGFWGWACSSYIAYLLGMCPATNYLVEAGENIKRTTRGMFLIDTNDTAPFALGKWTDLPTLGIKRPSSASGPSMTFRPPPQKGDPLLRTIDEWGKLDYSFNNLNSQDPTIFSQYPYGENWTYFNEDRSNIMNNSVEEQDVTEYQNVKHEYIGHHNNWAEYRQNLTDGFVDNSIFKIPEVGEI